MNPFTAPLIPSTDLRLGQHILGGGAQTRAMWRMDDGSSAESNLPHSILKVIKINAKSIGLIDTATNKYYRMSVNAWGTDKAVSVRVVTQ